ncbi:MAG TPA: hypothetical protein VJ744_03670 [Gaiellaceae bacterium]|nr:hypothetical protein [Gaiellaceae bacterium]
MTTGGEEIRDPRVFRWVESGVSGLARAREWDATALVQAPSLRGYEAGELEFRVFADGTVIGDVPPEAVTELTGELGLAPPLVVRAVRQGDSEWTVGALQLESELLALPQGISAMSLEVAVPPDGETMLLVDGEMVTEVPEGPEGEALATLESRGAARFQAFVARADRVEDGRWELTVDPL